MRLIDADALMKKIKSEMSTKVAYLPMHFSDFVEEQQTAYDIDKVMNEIRRNSGNGYRDIDGDYVPPMIETEEAIEIVKQGCVEMNDVCEWKYPKEIMDNTEFEVSCNSRPLKRGIVPNNFSFYDFKYCPYCGKKIKAVGVALI